jgi:prepilin-type processing-associated H-X9-DG protein
METLWRAGYVPKPGNEQPTVLLCPSQKPRVWPTYGVPGYNQQAYGMRFFFWLDVGNQYRITANDVATPYGDSFGPPPGFIFLSDSVLDLTYGVGYDGPRQRYYTRPHLPGAGSGALHLRHHRRGNFLFGDGHVEPLKKADLVGQHGTTTGTYTFSDLMIDESDASY